MIMILQNNSGIPSSSNQIAPKIAHFSDSAKLFWLGCCCLEDEDGEPHWAQDGARAAAFLSPARVAALAQAERAKGGAAAWEPLPQEDAEE